MNGSMHVAQLQQALERGAIVLGKCNMGEFALSPNESAGSAYGIVRNPYDLDRTTAGQNVMLPPLTFSISPCCTPS